MSRLILGLMLFATVACANNTVPTNVAGFYGVLKQEAPKKCCVPPAFTTQTNAQIAFENQFGLQMENVASSLSYDAIGQRVAVTMDLGFSNGTRETVTYIDLYGEGTTYEINDLTGGKVCYKYNLDTPFKPNCINDAAEYVGSSTFGDRALDTNTWYVQLVRKVGEFLIDQDVVSTVEDSECVPVWVSSRFYLGGTDTQLRTVTTSFVNFALGICDESVFVVPDMCEQVQEPNKIIHRVDAIIVLVTEETN